MNNVFHSLSDTYSSENNWWWVGVACNSQGHSTTGKLDGGGKTTRQKKFPARCFTPNPYLAWTTFCAFIQLPNQDAGNGGRGHHGLHGCPECGLLEIATLQESAHHFHHWSQYTSTSDWTRTGPSLWCHHNPSALPERASAFLANPKRYKCWHTYFW